jgi:hypothetical protein
MEVGQHEYVVSYSNGKVLKGDRHRGVYRHYLLTFHKKNLKSEWTFLSICPLDKHTSINERGVVIEKDD